MTALHQPPRYIEIPGRATSGPLIFAYADVESAPAYSQASYDSILALGEPVVPALEVRVSQDRQWVLYGAGDLSDWTTGEGRVESQAWSALQQLKFKDSKQGLLRLSDFLRTRNLPKLLLVVHNREVAGAKSLMEILGDRDEPQVTLIYAPAHRMNRELRKLRPYWYFGADAVMLTQWRLFSALWLDPLASEDFEWLPKGWFNSAPQKNARLEEELDRRRIGQLQWVSSTEELQQIQINDPHLLGVMTNRPKAVLQLMKVDR
ncbi:MAG: hypothetical protein AB7N80_06260 [Bdellovibrionales bacterium]